MLIGIFGEIAPISRTGTKVATSTTTTAPTTSPLPPKPLLSTSTTIASPISRTGKGDVVATTTPTTAPVVSSVTATKITVASSTTPKPPSTDPNVDPSGYIWCKNTEKPTQQAYMRGSCPTGWTSMPAPTATGGTVGVARHGVELTLLERETYESAANALSQQKCPGSYLPEDQNAIYQGITPFMVSSAALTALTGPAPNDSSWVSVEAAPDDRAGMWGKFYSKSTKSLAVRKIKPKKKNTSVWAWLAEAACDVVNSPITQIVATTALTVGTGPTGAIASNAAISAGRSLCSSGAAKTTCTAAPAAGPPLPEGSVYTDDPNTPGNVLIASPSSTKRPSHVMVGSFPASEIAPMLGDDTASFIKATRVSYAEFQNLVNPKPFYKKAWFWAIVGGVGAVTTAGVVWHRVR